MKTLSFSVVRLRELVFLYLAMAETIYSLEQINDWQSKLAALAKKPRTRFSKKQAVEAMIEQIELALQSHPYDEVADSLKQWGLDIAPGSLKQYVNAYRREHSSEAAAPTRKGAGGKGKKKSKAKSSNGRSPSVDDQAANAGAVNSAGGDSDTAASATKRRAKAASNRTPSGFLEMDEDL